MRVAFVPHIASPDFVDLFTKKYSWDHDAVDEFGLWSGQVLSVNAERAAQYHVGPNTWDALVHANVPAMLGDWGMPTTLQSGAIKEWDPQGFAIERNLHLAIDAVRREGGEISAVDFDEPLTSCIRGRIDREAVIPGYTYPYTWDTVGDLAHHTVRVGQMLKAEGVTWRVWEAWPQHSADDIIAWLRRLTESDCPPERFILDYDPLADVHESEFRDAVQQLREWCRMVGLEFGYAIGIAHRADSDHAFARQQSMQFTFAYRMPGGLPDWLYVISWRHLDDDAYVPRCLPDDYYSTHTWLINSVRRHRG